MLTLRNAAAPAIRSRPVQLVAVLWLIAAFYLLAAGHGAWLTLITELNLFEIILILITIRVTAPTAAPVAASGSRGRVMAQALVVLAVIVITAMSSLLPGGVPGWSQMVAAAEQFGERTLPAALVGGPGNAIANPVQYFVIPFVVLLLLGARPVELGFGKGHRSWHAALVWAAVPLLGFTILLISGALPARVLLRRLLGNSLQNGFFEEFLFRGALQTRLNALMSPAWALVAQGLLFGFWHINANTAMLGGDPVAGLAACVVSQSIMGIWFGIVFSRTRTLLAPTIQHVCMNTLAQSLG